MGKSVHQSPALCKFSGRATAPQEKNFLSSADVRPVRQHFTRAWLLYCNHYILFPKNRQAFAYTFFNTPQTFFMALIVIRTIIIFITLFAVMRLMGKRQIGEMQPYELVITLIVADLACIPMADNTIPLTYGLVAVVTVYVLHQLVCLIDLKIPQAKILLSGSPSVVINKNGIDEQQLKKNNLDVCDLVESLRGAGYFSLDEVDYALYEAGGSFSALPKNEKKEGEVSLPVIIVSDGKFHDKNIGLTGKDRGYFLEVLREQGLNELKKVLVLTVDGNGKAYAQEKGKSYKVFSLQFDKRLW